MEAVDSLQCCAADTVASLTGCIAAMNKLSIPNEQRERVSVALLYSSICQARSAALVVSHDPADSLFTAFILQRAQIDHCIRGAFFAKAATDDELTYFLVKDELLPREKGQPLGAKSLAKIVSASFEWEPADKLHAVVSNHWGVLSGMLHGGVAALNYYIHEDGLGAAPIQAGSHDFFCNSVALAHIAVSVAMKLATNNETAEVQGALVQWKEESEAYFKKWAPALPEAAA